MADEELQLDVTQPKSNKLMIILLIVLIVLVLSVGGIGAWLYMSKGNEGGDSAEAHGGGATKEVKPLLYQTMVPEFVVNFGPGSKVRYLQVDLQVSTRDEKAIEAVNTYRPVLRNDILVLLSGTNYEELIQRSGKEALQKKLLNVINKIIVDAMSGHKKTEEGKEAPAHTENEVVKGPIENVYFISFIMQ